MIIDKYFLHYLKRDNPEIYATLVLILILIAASLVLYLLVKYTSTDVKYYALYIVLGCVGVWGLYILYRETRPGWRQRADGVWVGSSR